MDPNRRAGKASVSAETRLSVGKLRQAKAGLRRDLADEDLRDAPSDEAFQRHFAVEDLAVRWGMSTDFVRRLFINEPGVVVFYKQRPGRRVYRTLRIPESVVLQVHRKMRRG